MGHRLRHGICVCGTSYYLYRWYYNFLTSLMVVTVYVTVTRKNGGFATYIIKVDPLCPMTMKNLY